ncbi:redox-sensing transcriptional repressor Rex [Pumilibacter muris]|uniref:redox-sensing transcriptional repressor Rex n=1 Tax=Pumilibacter muris TaxID=2941510 RepID=UPI00203E361E|nr:redox-sensing transcriptional repressor Rex [Pumilibacter muris]
MIEVKADAVASKATISRLPVYLRFLRDKLKAGDENVSSTAIADELRLNPVQVRKDLALVSAESGKPKLGFRVKELIEGIESFLGLCNTHDAVLCGVGSLGSTLLKYEGFKNYGLNIVAAFDTNAAVIGKKINGIAVLEYEALPKTVKRLNIKMGIITVPKSVAQNVADTMAQSGIRAIWNFAPVHLSMPEEVAVKYEDLAASLAVLGKKLEDTLRKE